MIDDTRLTPPVSVPVPVNASAPAPAKASGPVKASAPAVAPMAPAAHEHWRVAFEHNINLPPIPAANMVH